MDALTLPADLDALLRIPGVSGYESLVREHVRAHVRALGPLHEDAMGNLTLTLGDRGPTC